MDPLSEFRHIFFIGIGGIGMSALARYFLERGIRVSGYDRTRSSLTDQLAREGAVICYEADYSLPLAAGIDAVIYTPAVPLTHPVCCHLTERGLVLRKRAEVLGMISRSKRTIAIGGTHGKTTTSSITAHLLKQGGVDCTAFLGGVVANFNGNYVSGSSEWVVVEADEFDRSFLHLHPEISAILSTDADHLDIYGTPEALLETGFRPFASQTDPEGMVLLPLAAMPLFPEIKHAVSFGIEEGFCQAVNVRRKGTGLAFDYRYGSDRVEDLQFSLPGRHNVSNALVAVAIARKLGVTAENIRQALLSFRGIARRFEVVLQREDIVVISDYAHHPTELHAVLSAARELYPGKKLTGVFQPHLFTRTRDFMDDFAAALGKLDEVLLLPIYPAREFPIEGINSQALLDKIPGTSKRVLPIEQLQDALVSSRPEVLLLLGAGDLDASIPTLLPFLEKATHEQL